MGKIFCTFGILTCNPKPITGEKKSVVHWGQRKLLLHEIELLTQCVSLQDKALLVYAGAAPGAHITFLASLFPSVSFVSSSHEA